VISATGRLVVVDEDDEGVTVDIVDCELELKDQSSQALPLSDGHPEPPKW
jgi:hypothetical protein